MTYNAVNHVVGASHKPDLAKLLEDEYDIYDDERCVIRGNVKIELPRPSVYRSQSPLAATGG